MENWEEDTCVVCSHNDTDYLQDAYDGCAAAMKNKPATGDFMLKIDSYFHTKEEK